jgi:hypothetical protein
VKLETTSEFGKEGKVKGLIIALQDVRFDGGKIVEKF